MDTNNNYENKTTDQEKTTSNQNDKIPTKKVKRQATQEQLNHPLHGVKLTYILESLVEFYGWKYLEKEVNILCFKHNPTSSIHLFFGVLRTWLSLSQALLQAK